MPDELHDEELCQRIAGAYESVRLPVPVSEIVAGPARRPRPRLAMALAAAGVVIAVLAGTWLWPKAHPPVAPARPPHPTASSLAPTTTAEPVSTRQLQDWAAGLPDGPAPDIPTLSGRSGAYSLVDRGRHTRLPGDVMQLVQWNRTQHGLLVELWAPGETQGGRPDDQILAYVDLLRPSGELVQITHAYLHGVAVDPAGRQVAWLEPDADYTRPETVHVVDLATGRETSRFTVPPDELAGWTSQGLVFGGGTEFTVRTPGGTLVRQRAGSVEAVAGDRVLVQESGGCQRVLNLPKDTLSAPFACSFTRVYPGGQETVAPPVALSEDGTWMLVDGVVVETATLTPRTRLMPAGVEPHEATFIPIDRTRVWGKIYATSPQQTLGAVLCDLAAGRCWKTPALQFGDLP